MADDTYGPGDYDVEIGAISQALQEASGSQKRALESQMQSAQAARENALKIAQLQAETSRYGVDAQRETAMAGLKEKAREFDADHGLEIAKAYTTFASTPDMMFARNDFVSAMGRVGQGLTPQAAVTRSPGPQAKTWQDFAALAQYNGSTIPGASSSSGGASSGGSSASAASAPASSGGGAGQSTADPRVTAATAVMKALPPSEDGGHDENDFAALEAVRNLYTAGRPGIQKLGAARQKIALAGMARLGYDPNLVNEEYLRGLPGQRSPLLSA